MSDEPVTAIIPTYNRGDCIERSVNSALAQTQPCDQVIVIDDGSIDDTAARLANYRNLITVIRHDRNRGQVAAWNSAFDKINKGWIALLDSDDEWFHKKIQHQMAFNKRVKSFCSFTACWCVGKDIEKLSHVEKKGGWVQQVMRHHLITRPSCLMFTYDAIAPFSPLNEEFRRYADVELMVRLSGEHEFHYLDEVLTLIHKERSDHMSVSDAKHPEDREKIIEYIDRRGNE